jgi:hypothetical protein
MDDSVKAREALALKITDLSSDNYLTGDAVEAYCQLSQRGMQPGLQSLIAKSSPAAAGFAPATLAEVHTLLSEMAKILKQMHAAMAVWREVGLQESSQLRTPTPFENGIR